MAFHGGSLVDAPRWWNFLESAVIFCDIFIHCFGFLSFDLPAEVQSAMACLLQTLNKKSSVQQVMTPILDPGACALRFGEVVEILLCDHSQFYNQFNLNREQHTHAFPTHVNGDPKTLQK